MLAVQKENLPLIGMLVGRKASKKAIDKRGNSVFHYAADTSRGVIELLSPDNAPEQPGGIDVRNGEGNTPLHIACKNDKPDCVHALLLAGILNT